MKLPLQRISSQPIVSPVRIKSYFSRSVEDAMATARQELGEDAMLLNSRRTTPELQHLGQYEVIFGTDAPATPPGFPEAYATLTQSDVPPELARDLVQAAASRARASDFEQVLAKEIESRFNVDAALGRPKLRPRIAALVGPPGAGKTTALVKLAVVHGLANRRTVMLLSTDTCKIGAVEQLRSFAVILGVGFHVADTVDALAQHLKKHRGKDLILIDTAGLSPSDLETAGPLAQFLATRGDIDTQLVMPATMKPADLKRTADSFEIFRPQRLLFTRLDETASLGPVLGEAVRTGKPLSFFSTGQRIPEDLEPAVKSRVVRQVLPGHPVAAQRAAA